MNLEEKMRITFLLELGCDFDGVDGSRTGLVLRLFENFFLLRFNAANAPNPKTKYEKWARKAKRLCFFQSFPYTLNHFDTIDKEH